MDVLDVQLGAVYDVRQRAVELIAQLPSRDQGVDGGGVVAEDLGVRERRRGEPVRTRRGRRGGRGRGRRRAPHEGWGSARGVVSRAPSLAREYLVRGDHADERVGRVVGVRTRRNAVYTGGVRVDSPRASLERRFDLSERRIAARVEAEERVQARPAVVTEDR